MNTKKLIFVFAAAAAAGVLALMFHGMIGGGSKQAEAKTAPAPAEVAEVLVANARIDAGKPVTADQVRWQSWPVKIIDPSFIRKTGGQSASAVVDGTVARAPMVEGEPVTFAKIVKSQSAGFMAATIAPGMRAVSISVSVASVAGGFILPNNRIDLLLTQVVGDNPKRGMTKLVLANVRVLAIDQASDDKNQKAVSDVKTVTLELTPEQSRTVALAQAMGTLSLALRSIGDSVVADNTNGETGSETGKKPAGAAKGADNEEDQSGVVAVLRYGLVRKSAGGGGQ
jgi:Flp pilus assembly protein CpaB